MALGTEVATFGLVGSEFAQTKCSGIPASTMQHMVASVLVGSNLTYQPWSLTAIGVALGMEMAAFGLVGSDLAQTKRSGIPAFWRPGVLAYAMAKILVDVSYTSKCVNLGPWDRLSTRCSGICSGENFSGRVIHK